LCTDEERWYWQLFSNSKLTCFTIMTYDSLVYYLLFVSWFRPLVLFDRIGIIYMTTSVSRRLNMLCIMFKIFMLRLLIAPVVSSVSRRLNILCIMFKIIMLRLLIAPVVSSNISCNDTVRPVICEEGGVLLACGKNLHYH